MILVMNVGNSTIALGIYDDDQLMHHWELETDRHKTVDEYAMLAKALFTHANLQFGHIKGIIISSVVPPIMHVLEDMCKKYFHIKPLVVGPGVRNGLNIKYENPREVGADRIVNAVGAIEVHGGKTPLIIIDFGTAVTYCYITEKGDYLGGAIAPGIAISLEALYNQAAKLPHIEIAKPSSIIGKNTIAAMQAGVIFGFVGQVEGIVRRMKETSKVEPLVIATGRSARLIANETTQIDLVDEHLTLTGLYVIYKRNQ
jgi:type III pantothenate kinase